MKGGIWLDAGEGTYAQCVRLWGRDKTDSVIYHSRIMFISHMHADHHIGLVQLLSVFRTQCRARAPAPRPIAPHTQTQPPYAAPFARYNKTEEFEPPRTYHPIKMAQPTQQNAFYTSYAAASRKILLIGPRRLYTWLKDYCNTASELIETPVPDSAAGLPEDSLLDYFDFVCSNDLMQRSNICSPLPVLGITTVHTVVVKHCYDAYGIIIEHASGWKLVYSGDCAADQQLINAGYGATVLIHEATFEDDMVEEAAKKKHTTTKQAIEVGIL